MRIRSLLPLLVARLPTYIRATSRCRPTTAWCEWATARFTTLQANLARGATGCNGCIIASRALPCCSYCCSVVPFKVRSERAREREREREREYEATHNQCSRYECCSQLALARIHAIGAVPAISLRATLPTLARVADLLVLRRGSSCTASNNCAFTSANLTNSRRRHATALVPMPLDSRQLGSVVVAGDSRSVQARLRGRHQSLLAAKHDLRLGHVHHTELADRSTNAARCSLPRGILQELTYRTRVCRRSSGHPSFNSWFAGSNDNNTTHTLVPWPSILPTSSGSRCNSAHTNRNNTSVRCEWSEVRNDLVVIDWFCWLTT